MKRGPKDIHRKWLYGNRQAARRGKGDEVYSFLPLEDDYPAALWRKAVIRVSHHAGTLMPDGGAAGGG